MLRLYHCKRGEAMTDFEKARDEKAFEICHPGVSLMEHEKVIVENRMRWFKSGADFGYAFATKERDEYHQWLKESYEKPYLKLHERIAELEAALEYQLTAWRKICEGSMFTPESERTAAEKIARKALEGK